MTTSIGRAKAFANGTDLLHRIEPLGMIALIALIMLCLALALLVVRHHGRAKPRGHGRAKRERRLPEAARIVIPFVLAFAAVIAFVRIAREMSEGETSSFDEAVALAIHRLDSAPMDIAMRAFTFMGSAFAVISLAAVVVVWAIRRKDYRAAVVLVVVLITNEMLNVVLKRMFGRARPTLFQEIDTLHSYSFPSGHSMAAVAAYGMMGIVVSRLAPVSKRRLAISLSALIFLIGLSRIFLGVHWPTDVLAGFAAGGFLLLAGAVTLEGLPRGR